MHTELHTAELRSERAYGELKQRLLAGEFRLGAPLRETGLAESIGVSRTPVREALLRLQSEGLLARTDEGWLTPVVPDVAGIRMLYEVRAGLELQALRRPAKVGTTHDAAALDDLIGAWESLATTQPDPDPAFVLFDEAFHVALAEAAGNPALADLLRQVNERIRIVRMLDFLTPDRVASTITEHLAIVRAVRAGDIDAADRAFVAHLDLSQSVVEQRVAAAVTRMASA